jgi:hypothetical protein
VTPRAGPATRLMVIVAITAVAVTGWLGWLGWHAQKHEVPGSTAVEGPYAAWQVTALALTLAVVVAVSSWLRFGTTGVLTASVATTVMFSLDASTQETIGANLWPVGATALLIGALLGLGLVAILAAGVKLATHRLLAR